MKTLSAWLVLILLAASARTGLRAAPVNDNFTNAIPLGNATLIGGDINASSEPAEPDVGATNTVWWSWTAPHSGLAAVDLDGSSGNYYVGVFVGYTVDNLAYVGGNPFVAVSNITYHIQVSGYAGSIIALSIQPDGMTYSNLLITPNGDNSEGFSASVTVANSGSSPQNVEVDIVKVPGYSATQLGIANYLPLPPAQVLAAYILTNLAAGAQTNFTITNTCPPPSTNDQINFGIGWDIFLNFKGSYTNSVLLFPGVWPNISGYQPGGDVSRYDPPPTDAAQAPLQLVSGVINGPASVWENSTASYSLTLTLTNGIISTNVTLTNAFWTVSPSPPFMIDSDGVFTAGIIPGNTTVTITAAYSLSTTTNYISTNITVLVLPTPVIVNQPANLAVGFGLPADFTVTATGNAPLLYQWNFDGHPLPGATHSALLLPYAQLTNSGTYSVVVSNSLGVAVSSNATLAVTETAPPTVTIVNPNPVSYFTTFNPFLTVSGTASDIAGVAQVLISDNSKGYQPANGASNWSFPVMLSPGTNLIIVKSVNLSGLQSLPATEVIIFDITPNTAGLALFTNGDGTIQHTGWPKSLIPGKNYTATAIPKPGSLFSNWVGGTNFPWPVLSASARYKFTMQSNLVLEANFVTNPFIPVAGIYNGLFTKTNGITEQTAGMLKGLKITGKGTYSGALLIDGASHALSGSFNLAGQATNHISHPALTVAMTLNGNESPPLVTGTVSNEDSWVATLTAGRATNTLHSGEYTLLIHPDTNNAPFHTSPGGDGYALITNNAGTAKITGSLADGTVFSQSVPVSMTGAVPIYANLYGGKGLLLGWINLAPANAPAAALGWVHPSSPHAGLFKNSFTSTNPVALSPWTNPPAASLLANLTNLSILEPTNAIAIATNDFTITISNNFKIGEDAGPASLSGALAPKTGLLTVITGGGASKLTGHGLILPNETNGGGYFLTKTNAGAIQLGR